MILEERLLTFEDLSAHTGIPVGTLRDWRMEGKGPKGFRLGNRVRFKESDVDAWLHAQYTAADTDR